MVWIRPGASAFNTSAPALDAAVHQNGDAPGDLLDYFGQCVNRGGHGIEAARAVIGDDDRRFPPSSLDPHLPDSTPL